MYRCKTADELGNMVKILVAMGYKYDHNLDIHFRNPEDFRRTFNTYQSIRINENNQITACNPAFDFTGIEYKTSIAFVEAASDVNLMVGEFEVIKIDGGVKIGCTTVTIDKIKEVLAFAESN